MALILVTLLAVVLPVSAVEMNITLDRTYQFKLANVSSIQAIDIGNLTLSRVEVQSTEGGGTDLQTIHTPVIRQVTRNFDTMSGTFNGVTVTITGDNPSTVDLTTKPDFKIYTKPIVPTFDVSAPGHAGNPMVTKYNDSWVKEDTGSLSSLFRSVEGGYLYKTAGAAYASPNTGTYLTSGTWDISVPNLTYTLDKNKVADLSSFTGDSTASFNLGYINPTALASTGKYYAGAILHDEAAKNISVYAMYPVVILKAPTPMHWTSSIDTTPTTPFTYFNASTEDIRLNFTGMNPDLGSITKVTYLIINDSVQYDMYMHIDTHKLAENAETRWQTSFTPGTQIIDLLYDGIQNDVGTPFNYTMTAVGFADPAPSTEWSAIAITPGFGISGKANGHSVTVPAENMSQLNPGLYDIYVMGTDADNNIVALDQKQLLVTALPPTNIGVHRNGHFFYLDYNGNAKWDGKVIDRVYDKFGNPGDMPTTGDWNGDGNTEIGVLRDGRYWYLDYNGNGLWNGTTIDRKFGFGNRGDMPATGDWNGDGTTEIGLLRNGRYWYLDYNGNGLWDGKVIDRLYGFGNPGDVAATGDWNGDGKTEVGVLRNGRFWYLDYNGNGYWNGRTIDRLHGYGNPGDQPAPGDWNGDGKAEVGVLRDGHWWYFDFNADGYWSGKTIDRYFRFGNVGDLPATGKWNTIITPPVI